MGEIQAYTTTQLRAIFWKLAFMDQVRWQSVLRQTEEADIHVEKPLPGVDVVKIELERVIYTMLTNGGPYDGVPEELLWPVIKSEVEPFGIDAVAVANRVYGDWEEDLLEADLDGFDITSDSPGNRSTFPTAWDD